MTDIEKRAKALGHKYARQYHHNNCFLEHDKTFVYSNNEITDACIEMATDQRNIDIERAWGHFKDIIKDYCLETGQEYEDLSMWYNEFRQAMEE